MTQAEVRNQLDSHLSQLGWRLFKYAQEAKSGNQESRRKAAKIYRLMVKLGTLQRPKQQLSKVTYPR